MSANKLTSSERVLVRYNMKESLEHFGYEFSDETINKAIDVLLERGYNLEIWTFSDWYNFSEEIGDFEGDLFELINSTYEDLEKEDSEEEDSEED